MTPYMFIVYLIYIKYYNGVGFESGKVTNTELMCILCVCCSLWDYTNVVMNFLCEPKPQSGSQTLTFDWLKYFDVVITGRLFSYLR